MIDTCHLWLRDLSSFTSINLQTYLEQFLDEPKWVQIDNTVILYGNLSTLKVKVSPTSISIQGSLSRYFLDTNVKTLTPVQTQLAFEKLADEMHLDISQFTATRIDIAENMEMNHNPSYYFKHLGICGKLARLEQPNGLFYKGTQKELLIYDKDAQMKASKSTRISENPKYNNLLRIEVRFKRNLEKQLKLDEVKVHKLLCRKIYHKLVDAWSENYYSIHKYRIVKPTQPSVSTLQGFKAMLMSRGIKELGGEATVESLITQGVQLGYIPNSSVKKRLKDQLKALSQTDSYTEISTAVNELDLKVKETSELLKTSI
ncbi:phage/plasmid replication domain-containing protein [Pontibacter anaerobius]|uniref:Replication-associated protein G2P N-terminal domain-containing protein n=1 Tax=Pontibacter anaerobius TaxID=2993940 RepID=A0ABT3RHZ9_9BACT|nr:phage/plasmid replication protein [Pontibacter anaerobius]MCX2741467.1 hypothetical protein [Pontibacter anaerobius]